jgi:hypothetical protein
MTAAMANRLPTISPKLPLSLSMPSAPLSGYQRALSAGISNENL